MQVCFVFSESLVNVLSYFHDLEKKYKYKNKVPGKDSLKKNSLIHSIWCMQRYKNEPR